MQKEAMKHIVACLLLAGVMGCGEQTKQPPPVRLLTTEEMLAQMEMFRQDLEGRLSREIEIPLEEGRQVVGMAVIQFCSI